MIDEAPKKLECFSIDDYGMAAIIRLVEKRLIKDIEMTKLNQEIEEGKIKRIEGTGKIKSVRKAFKERKKGKIESTAEKKKIWLEKWKMSVKEIINEDLKRLSVEDLLKKYDLFPHKKFLIMQEAILTPVYSGIDNAPKGLKELNFRTNCEEIARVCGFSNEESWSVLKNTELLLKKFQGYQGKIIKWTLAGTTATLLTMGIAAPAIAGLIGGYLGFQGAAALTAGLAFIGGGAVAAGGLGMAGGLQFLIGGGAFFGIVGSMGAVKFLTKVKKETFEVSMVKIVNYARYLAENKNEHFPSIFKRVMENFMDFKFSFEKDLLLLSIEKKDRKDLEEKRKILQETYKALLVLKYQ